jgi:MFS family permease
MGALTLSCLDRLHAADVGLKRLSMAVAATAATFLTVCLLLWSASGLGLGASYVIPGLMVTAIATMAVGLDTDHHHRTLTLVLMPLPAAFGLSLGTALFERPVATALGFMGLVVATLVGSMAGPRGIVLALAAIGGYYGASLVGISTADLPTYLTSTVLGTVIAVGTLQFLFRERSATTAPRMMRSVRARATRAATAAEGRRGAELDQAVDQFAVAVAATRTHVQTYPDAWPEHLRLGAGSALGTFEVRFEQALTRVRDGASPRILDHFLSDPVVNLDWDSATTSRAAVQIAGVSHDAPADPGSRLQPASGGRSQVSMAVQLLVAAGLAITVATLISPERWFWGVLAALVMLFGTSSAADAIGKGSRRIVGTAAALPVGAALATVTQGHVVLLIVCLVIAMFLQQYTADVAYGWSIFFLTIFLYLVFAFTTPDPADALLVRLLETSAGAVVGLAVALLILPTRSLALLRGRALDVVDAVEAAVTRVMANAPSEDVAEAVLEAHRRFLALKAEAAASRKGWPLSAAHRARALQLAAAAVMLHELRALNELYAAGQRTVGTYRRDAAEVVASLAGVRQQLAAVDALTSDAGEDPEQQAPVAPDSLDESLQRLGRSVKAVGLALANG